MTSSETPRAPTVGWCLSELERRGARARGVEWTEATLRRALLDAGVEGIESYPNPSTQPKGTDR